MKTNRPSTKDIKRQVRAYFDRQIGDVQVPPVPEISTGEDQPKTFPETSIMPFPRKRTFSIILPRAAAAILLLAIGSVLFFRPIKYNPLAATITYIAEKEAIEEKITSGLQKAGNFIYENL